MATDGFNTEELSSALKDVTNIPSGGVAVKDEAAHQRARDKGWVAPQGFDYDTYNAPLGQARQGNEGGEAVTDAGWNHGAERYEWKTEYNDEYGDVGPPIPELENQLFRSAFIMRKGIKFDK